MLVCYIYDFAVSEDDTICSMPYGLWLTLKKTNKKEKETNKKAKQKN